MRKNIYQKCLSIFKSKVLLYQNLFTLLEKFRPCWRVVRHPQLKVKGKQDKKIVSLAIPGEAHPKSNVKCLHPSLCCSSKQLVQVPCVQQHLTTVFNITMALYQPAEAELMCQILSLCYTKIWRAVSVGVLVNASISIIISKILTLAIHYPHLCCMILKKGNNVAHFTYQMMSSPLLTLPVST